MSLRVKLALAVVLLAACVAVAYWNAPKGEFIWDDVSLIVFDYQIKSWNFLKEIFTRDFFGFSDDNRKYGYYRPLVTITYALDWKLHGGEPAGYHLTNLLIHYVSTLLVFFIFYRLVNRKLLTPLLAAGIFAVHPIHTESVTWIAGRTDPLCALFFLAAFLAYMLFVERVAARRGFAPPPGADPRAKDKPFWHLLAVMAAVFVLSLLAKEMAVSLPLVAAAYALVFVKDARKPRGAAWLLSPAALLLAIVGAYFLFRSWRIGFSPQAKDPFNALATILTFVKTLGYYTLKTFVPVHLSAYIQNPLVESPFDPGFLAGFVFLALMLAATAATVKRDPTISFALMFYMLTLGPLSNFVRISGPKDMGFMTAERFLYLPSVAVCFVLAAALARLIGQIGAWAADREWATNVAGRRTAALVVTAALLVSYTALTIRRNTDWYKNEQLFNKMIADAPNATLLYVVLGNVYRLDKKYDEAEKILNRALEYLAPRDREEPAWIYNDLAGIYAEQHRFDEALQLMKLASRTRLHNSAVLYNYGEIYRAMGDCRTAIEYYQRSLVIYRDNRSAFEKMGFCFQQRQVWDLANKAFLTALTLTPHNASLFNEVGFDYMRLGNLEKAEAYLRQALAEKPDYAKAAINLAQLRYRQKRVDEAERLLSDVLAKDEENADAHATLGYILADSGNLAEAGPHIHRALEINPKNEQARLTLATLNIDAHPRNARIILQELLEDSPENIEAMYAMGLSYQTEGNVDEAVRWFKKALNINPKHHGALAGLQEMGAAFAEDSGLPAVATE
jgi:tetratricopeptide (TPR) repeat protein